jgi:hypothetical protein
LRAIVGVVGDGDGDGDDLFYRAQNRVSIADPRVSAKCLAPTA